MVTKAEQIDALLESLRRDIERAEKYRAEAYKKKWLVERRLGWRNYELKEIYGMLSELLSSVENRARRRHSFDFVDVIEPREASGPYR